MRCCLSLATLLLLLLPCLVVAHGSCSLFSGSVSRHLDKQGFHRDLVTSLRLAWSAELSGCRILFVERLPRGVYVDPYQLSRIHGNRYRVDAVVDIEAMAHDSDWLSVLVWAELNATESGQGSAVVAEAFLPLHARYHRADQTERIAAVHIDPPQVFLGCDLDSANGDPCAATSLPCRPSGGATCSYRPVQVADSRTVLVTVPLGDLRDLEMVVVGTTVVVAASCLLLLTVVADKRLVPP